MQASQTIHRSYHPIFRGFQFFYTAIAWLFVLGVGIQVYFAGLAFFGATGNWIGAHAGLGWFLFLTPILMLLLLPLTRFPRGIVFLNLFLFLDVFLQVSFVTFMRAFDLPELTALHPVNALVLFMIAISLALKAQNWIRATRKTNQAAETSAPAHLEGAKVS